MMFLQVDFTRTSLEVQGVQRGVARRGAPIEIEIIIYRKALKEVVPNVDISIMVYKLKKN